jgi:hypothetical protein
MAAAIQATLLTDSLTAGGRLADALTMLDAARWSVSSSPQPPVDFVAELVEAEEKHTTVMEQRALAVITSSGALVTLLLGISALVTRVQQFRVPGPARLLAALRS